MLSLEPSQRPDKLNVLYPKNAKTLKNLKDFAYKNLFIVELTQAYISGKVHHSTCFFVIKMKNCPN